MLAYCQLIGNNMTRALLLSSISVVMRNAFITSRAMRKRNARMRMAAVAVGVAATIPGPDTTRTHARTLRLTHSRRSGNGRGGEFGARGTLLRSVAALSSVC